MMKILFTSLLLKVLVIECRKFIDDDDDEREEFDEI
jgi:hypothetical protein